MKKLKYFYNYFITLSFIFLLSLLIPSITTYAKETKAPSIIADSAVIIDADTGQIIYSKNADKKYFPASTTKVMTALVVLENSNLHDIVKIGKNPPFAEGSSIGLKEGEEFSVETLLTGLLLESGNDCAEALAEHIAGSTENFAKLMNKKAEEIGCKNTVFKNPSGLPNPDHVTTAYDLSLILREAIKYDDFVRISSILTKKLPPSNLDKFERYVNNHNYLINKASKYYYKYAIAGKTGYTDVARHTFTIAAKKDGRTLVGSFLKAEDKNKNFEDIAKLLDYSFDNSENIKIYSKGDVVEEIKLTNSNSLPLVLENDFTYTKLKDGNEELSPKLKFDLPNNIKTKSLTKGEVITTASVLVNGTELGKVNILSGKNRIYNPSVALQEFFLNNPVLAISIVIFIIIFILIIIRIVVIKRKNMLRKKRWRELTNKKKKSIFKR